MNDPLNASSDASWSNASIDAAKEDASRLGALLQLEFENIVKNKPGKMFEKV